MLSPKSQKANKGVAIVNFGGKFLKFCFKIKTYAQMLEKIRPLYKVQDNDTEYKNTNNTEN